MIDPSGKQNGRGAYIKKDVTLLDRLKKGQLLRKQFAVEVSEDFYDLLKKELHE
jgi:predicted RNA-binding protein YlxR (DUF448 family)